MSDQGIPGGEAGLPLKDTLGPKERSVKNNTLSLLLPDKQHAGLQVLTRHTGDREVRELIATADSDLPKVGSGTRADWKALVEAEGRRRNPRDSANYNDRSEAIAQLGTQPYLDIAGAIPADAYYPASYINSLFEPNTPENRTKGFNAAHLAFAHTTRTVAEAIRQEQRTPGSQTGNDAYRYGSEIAITAFAQFLPALDEAFTRRGMSPFSVDSHWSRTDQWGDNVWQYLDNMFGQIPGGRQIMDTYIMEAAAGKRVAALAPKPEVASSPTEVSNTGENPFTRAARLRREEQARLAETRANLDNPFDGVQ